MERYVITINEKTDVGKGLVNFMKSLKNVVTVEKLELDTDTVAMEDRFLGELIEEGMKAENVSEAEIMKALG